LGVESEGRRRLYLASWGERLAAWLIDLVLVGSASLMIWLAFRYLLPGAWWYWPRRPPQPRYSIIFILTPFWLTRPLLIGEMLAASLLFYWAVTEGVWGQSLGKRLLGLRVVDLEGNKAGLLKSLIESFGKVFLLPLDVAVSLVIPECRERRQRLLNYLSGTIVIRIRGKPPATDVEYIRT
jgi:uncharacterized RDD family membrane protein YckC